MPKPPSGSIKLPPPSMLPMPRLVAPYPKGGLGEPVPEARLIVAKKRAAKLASALTKLPERTRRNEKQGGDFEGTKFTHFRKNEAGVLYTSQLHEPPEGSHRRNSSST